ncbi:MAG: hypothetical protein AB1499_04335 [Nitrospirota bacterium]
MIRRLLIAAGLCLCLFFSIQTGLSSASQSNPATMQNHIQQVKAKNPTLYQEMVDKAGGVVTSCLSCHTDINKNTSGRTTYK